LASERESGKKLTLRKRERQSREGERGEMMSPLFSYCTATYTKKRGKGGTGADFDHERRVFEEGEKGRSLFCPVKIHTFEEGKGIKISISCRQEKK